MAGNTSITIDALFELVHTLPDYYDGPRGGIADFLGAPHVFASLFLDIYLPSEPCAEDVFLLRPISSHTFDLALEDWRIWLRFYHTPASQLTASDKHPALSTDRERHDALVGILEPLLRIDDDTATTRAHATFRGTRPENGTLEVAWRPIAIQLQAQI